MPLVGLPIAFLGACIADLKGSEGTRPFTRTGFWALVALELGISVSGLASFGGDVVATVMGFL